MLTVGIDYNHGSCAQVASSIKTMFQGCSITLVNFVAHYISAKGLSDIDGIISTSIIHNHNSIYVFSAALNDIANGMGFVIRRHGCNSNGHSVINYLFYQRLKSLCIQLKFARISSTVNTFFRAYTPLIFGGF
ncbi:hypothetical protein SDC9_110725 [bioreactor metagenome]|uniref:Uncharacterized protein n=1 Tax=bioreactor metagenome TaxID=1076179 RepID=A0A645BH09_9ZZZZ